MVVKPQEGKPPWRTIRPVQGIRDRELPRRMTAQIFRAVPSLFSLNLSMNIHLIEAKSVCMFMLGSGKLYSRVGGKKKKTRTFPYSVGKSVLYN